MRTLALLLVLSTAAWLPGCLESTDKLTLEKDGSGTIASTYVVDRKKFKELTETARMMFAPDADVSELPNPFAEAWFRKAAEAVEGFDVTACTAQSTDTVNSTKVEAKFTSLEAAAKGGAFFSSTVKLKLVDFEPPSDVTGPGAGKGPKVKAWKLTLKDAVAAEYNGMRPADILPMFAALLDTLKIGRTVTLPTTILDTNGKKSEDGKSVSWTVDYDMILEGEDLEMMVVFATADDLALEPFAYVPDMPGMAPRFLEPPPKPKAPENREDDGDK